jgi:hypothetical protein
MRNWGSSPIQGDRLPERGDRFLHVARLRQSRSQIVPRPNEIRLRLNRLANSATASTYWIFCMRNTPSQLCASAEFGFLLSAASHCAMA